MISPKPLDQITKDDIDALVADGTSERRTIEYKQSLPGTMDADKKEFVADVSSIANAQGGDLVYGISATDGVPTDAPGLSDFNEDKVRLRLESLMRDGLDPRLHAVQMHEVAGFQEGPILILRIAKSWSGPHRVKLGGTSRFYLRGSAGKFEMDTSDMRTAFAAAGDVPQKLREWRRMRISEIASGTTPARIRDAPTLVLHLVPFSLFSSPYACAASDMIKLTADLLPIGVSSSNTRINVDGLLQFSPDAADAGRVRAFTQTYRSGAVEAVKAGICKSFVHGHGVLAPDLENVVVESAARYLSALSTLRIPTPLILFVTVLRARGACVADGDFDFHATMSAIDRDVLELPELLIENYDVNVTQTLKPAFDGLWNACGFKQSLNYDANGNWAPRLNVMR